MLPTFDDGIPNAMYDPTATGVVYTRASLERNFNNPLYLPVAVTQTPSAAAASNHNGGHSMDGGEEDVHSSSGLYSTIDHTSPKRLLEPRPPQNGQYSVITDTYN